MRGLLHRRRSRLAPGLIVVIIGVLLLFGGGAAAWYIYNTARSSEAA